ncbi:MAG: RidA family protein [Gemmatimonadota bacterium]
MRVGPVWVGGAGLVALALAGCAPPPGQGAGPGRSEPSGRRFVNPGTLAALDGFTHAVRIGFITYVSGEVPLDSSGTLVGPGDLAAQAKQAFANLGLTLRIAGNEPGDVVKLTVYVVNYHPQDFAVIRRAAPEFFPARNPPAGIVVGVTALPREGMLIAVDAIAQAPALFRPLSERRD